MFQHVALLGDSIFDNRAYTDGQPDVVTHLRDLLPASWEATLCAVDGATSGDLDLQWPRVPRAVTHVVLSVGGNDALMSSGLLRRPVTSTAVALTLFNERSREFEAQYRRAVSGTLALGRDTTLCTIYNGNLAEHEVDLARVALMLFNDAILRVAFEERLTVIDLRLVCSEPEDYANPIEPSGSGGRKIAEAIARALGAVGRDDVHSRVIR